MECLDETSSAELDRPPIENYTQYDWCREQLADPVCRATMAYLERGCPIPFPSDVLTDVVDSVRVQIAPTKDDVLELAGKSALVEVSHDGRTVQLLVRRPSTRKNDLRTGRVASLLDDEPTRIFVPMLLRPLVLQRCHADVSCHFGVARTSRMLERFYWWIGMEQRVRWWIRRCSMCQARKSPRRTVR